MRIEFILIPLFLSLDILEVSPSIGSTAGGTVLSIKLKGFDERATKVSVEVAGNTCKMKYDDFERVCSAYHIPDALKGLLSHHKI